MVHRLATHTATAQRLPKHVTKDAKGYMSMRLTVPKSAGCICNKRFIYNMDQTNNYFVHAPKNTIQLNSLTA